jgi:hypothetical protein
MSNFFLNRLQCNHIHIHALYNYRTVNSVLVNVYLFVAMKIYIFNGRATHGIDM